MQLKNSVKITAIIAGLLLVSAAAFAAGPPETAWPDPDATISVVVPFGAGGGTDLIFRQFVQAMNEQTEAEIIVENIGGAGSATGTNEVLSRPADGYTVLASGAHTVTATLQGLTEGYRELEGIVGLNWDPFIVAVHRDSPWESFADVLADAQDDPESISFGNAGMGGATGVLTVGMDLHFDGVFNVTPFDGGADLLSNTLGRFVDLGVFSQTEVVEHLGSLRPLMIVHPERSTISELSDVPTYEEEGFADLNVPFGSYRSLSVREGTPDEAKQALAAMARAAFETESFQNYMRDSGLLPEYSELEETDEYFRELEGLFRPILEAAGLVE